MDLLEAELRKSDVLSVDDLHLITERARDSRANHCGDGPGSWRQGTDGFPARPACEIRLRPFSRGDRSKSRGDVCEFSALLISEFPDE